MNSNPVNLGVRFLLVIAMLVIFAFWGWHLGGPWMRYLGVLGLPAIAAALWGIFRIPNDPKPAPVEIPGIVRLLLEWALFGSAVWALYDLEYCRLSFAMLIIVILHYIVSYDRTWAMLRNKRYDLMAK